jgi:hypothetical protein
MNPKVLRKYKRLQNDFDDLLSELNKEEVKVLETSPSNEKWSVTQVMYHLNTAESLSVKYVSKKRLGSAQLKPTGLEAALRLLIARVSFYLPIKYKAPKVLGLMPAHVSYHEIKNEWQSTRKQLSSMLESLKDEELRKPIFRQPTFGRWNIFQMLSFMQAHFNRHRKQIRRTVKSVEKNKNQGGEDGTRTHDPKYAILVL